MLSSRFPVVPRSIRAFAWAAAVAVSFALPGAADDVIRTDDGNSPLPPIGEILTGTRDAVSQRVTDIPDPGPDFAERGTRNGRVLVWSTANGSGNTGDVAAWIEASRYFDEVVGVNQNTAFTLAELLEYDGVLFFSNNGAGDASVGDVLADYADTGRRLVVCTFADLQLAGRIVTDGILPLLKEGSGLYSNATIGSKDSSRYWLGVNAITGYYRADVKASSNAVVRGRWSDNEPLLATKGSVVSVNLFPDDSFGNISGDYRAMYVNALLDKYTFDPPYVASEPYAICNGGKSKLSLQGQSYRTYYISLSDLVNMDSNCGNTGSQYDACTGNNPGFRWQDEGVGAATAVYIYMKVGVECSSATYGTRLNGVDDTSFSSTPAWCDCNNASGSPYVYLTMNSDNYEVGGLNQFRVTGTCFWGLIPEQYWNNAYAIVYVYYDDQKTFRINADQLVNLPTDCGSTASKYICFDANPSGFNWVDRSNAQARSVRVEMHTGVECNSDGHTYTTTLNGDADDSYARTPYYCECDGSSNSPNVTLDLNPASYKTAGEVNRFRITNNAVCWGLAPNGDWGSAYALVTVDYDVDRKVTWYKDECGGTVIGGGESITVSPASSSQFYARVVERADQAEIDTYSGWNGSSSVSSFGEPNTATYGQTFVAAASTLQTITFAIDDNQNPDFVDFDAYVTAWDNTNQRATGPVLWTAGPFTTSNNNGNGGYEKFKFETGGVKLTPGDRYVAFLSASNRFDGKDGTSRWAFRNADVYSGGTFVYANNGKDFGSLFSNAWSSISGDLAFDLTFADEAVSDQCAVGYVYVVDPPEPTKALADPDQVCNEAPVSLSLAATDIDVYDIFVGDLVGLPNDCGTTQSKYNVCTGDAGFAWTDTGSIRPRHVTVQFSVGVECANGYVHPTLLNGAGGPSFPQTPNWCNCDGNASGNVVTLELDPRYYYTGNVNQFLVTSTTCWGLIPNPDWGGAYARVIVDRALTNDYYQVEWREGSCNGPLVGVGDPLVINPDHSATYYASTTAPRDFVGYADTFGAWDGGNAIAPFGEPNTATYGQTFKAIGTHLYYFAVSMDDGNNPEPVTFDAYIMKWDDGAGHPTGPILWQSGPYTTNNNGGNGGFQYFGFYTPDQYYVPVIEGERYVLFLCASNYFNGTDGTARWAYTGSDAYADGTFVFLNNGSDFGALFNTPWNAFGSDLAFQAYFYDSCKSDKCTRVHVDAGHGERGDSNGDNSVDFNDIDGFVAALISCENWADETGLPIDDCTCRNDIDQNGSVDFNDIDGFVECIINSGCL